MRLLAVSDLHGSLAAVWSAIDVAQPDILLCCGDWGDPGDVDLDALSAFTQRMPVYTVYGNHDDLDLLAEWENRDGSAVLLEDGSAHRIGELVLGGISGIWANSHRKAFYITDEEVDEAARRLAASGPVDLLMTHGCPSGVADLTISNRHGGQPCFLHAFQTVRPQVYLTGHLHRAQQYMTKDGHVVRNIGATPRGEAVLLTYEAGKLRSEALVFDVGR